MYRDFVEGSDDLFDFGGSRAVSKLETFGTGLGEMTSVRANRATTFSERIEQIYIKRDPAQRASAPFSAGLLCIRVFKIQSKNEPVNVHTKSLKGCPNTQHRICLAPTPRSSYDSVQWLFSSVTFHRR